VQAPAAPALAAVTVDPHTTALLVLDLVHQRCDSRDKPRCPPTVDHVSSLVGRARTSGVPVIYSLVRGSTPADVMPAIKPEDGDPIVTAGADKFLGTDLEQILRAKKIDTVIVTGTAAEGAVLTTAGEAALRGLKVIVPVDGMSSALPYAEQYTSWHLVHAPGPAGHVTLTRTDMIRF
jgi:nicotinamidase-related amidase